MNRTTSGLLAGILGLGLALGSSAWGAPEKAPAAKPAPAVKVGGRWGQMATALKLSDEQVKALADKVKAMDDGLKAFDESKSATLKPIKEQQDAVAKERKALADKLEGEVMALFTAEQVQSFQAAEMVQRALGGQKLSDEQQAKAKQIAADAVKALAAVKADDKDAAATKAGITRKASEDLHALLTPEQKQAAAAEDVLKEARKGLKAAKLTAEGEQAVHSAAADAAKQIATLDAQRGKIIEDLRAKITAEAAKVPAPEPKKKK